MSAASINSATSSQSMTRKCGYEKCDGAESKILRCSRCQLQWYCRKECQAADWPKHKVVCQIRLKKDNTQFSSGGGLLKDTVIEKQMPIPGLRLFENVIPDVLHNQFIEVMIEEGIPEKNVGLYDGYNFNNEERFDRVFNPLVKIIFDQLRILKILKPLQKLACTLIGYEKDGYITKHIDSPLLSGHTVIVISFNSSIVLNFYSEKVKGQHQKIFVPPKSMYCISDEAYDWSHEILPHEDEFEGKKFTRDRKFAILFTQPGTVKTGMEQLDFRG
jgi:hypothetical protein